jgi:Restriction endonuclease
MISPAAYGALSEALTAIIWNKDAFERYIRRALHGHPELLVGLNFHQLKRIVADELVDRLMADEDRYQSFTLKLMTEIADMDSFPNLERQPKDRALHLERAHKAVANLRRFTTKYAVDRDQQHTLRTDLADSRAQAREELGFTRELEKLKAEFLAMSASNNPQQRGRDFERFLNKLFGLFDLEPRLAYNLAHEQIDGALTFDTDDYIIEAKWWQDPVERKDVAELAAKVESKRKNTLGLFISVSGFSAGARETYSTKTPFLTIDGDDLFLVLDRRIALDELLRHKKRHASETGSCYYPAREIVARA